MFFRYFIVIIIATVFFISSTSISKFSWKTLEEIVPSLGVTNPLAGEGTMKELINESKEDLELPMDDTGVVVGKNNLPVSKSRTEELS